MDDNRRCCRVDAIVGFDCPLVYTWYSKTFGVSSVPTVVLHIICTLGAACFELSSIHPHMSSEYDTQIHPSFAVL